MSAIRRVRALLAELGAAVERAQSGADTREVYFVRAGDDGPIKIGYAREPQRRLNAMQADNHMQLHLLATLPGGPELERALHYFFAPLRVRGEWFRNAPPLSTFVALVTEAEAERPSEAVKSWLLEAIAA
jgi:hypothetical protein